MEIRFGYTKTTEYFTGSVAVAITKDLKEELWKLQTLSVVYVVEHLWQNPQDLKTFTLAKIAVQDSLKALKDKTMSMLKKTKMTGMEIPVNLKGLSEFLL